MQKKTLIKYRTIVIDPPWRYSIWGSGSAKALVQGISNRPIPLPYDWMSIEQIKELPVSNLADNNCELYLRVTQKYLPEAFDIVKYWGFKYCKIDMV